MSAFKKIICLLLLFCTHESIAQEWLWTRTSTMVTAGNGSVEGYNVAMDPSGNIITIGNYTMGSIVFGNDTFHSGASNFVVTKYDSAGNLLWVKGSAGTYSTAFGLACDPSGNIYVAGQFQFDTMSLGGHKLTNTNQSLRDFFLYKLDPNGNVLWAKNDGGTNATLSWPVRTDNAGNVYFFGSYTTPTITFGSYTLTNTSTSGHRDLFLVKFDPAGNTIWARSAGSDGEELQSDMTIDDLGNVYITGWMISGNAVFGMDTVYKMTANASKYNAYMAKYDSSGNEQWAKLAGGGDLNVTPFSIKTDNANNVYLAGIIDTGTATVGSSIMYNPGPKPYDGFFAKFSTVDGSPIWAKQFTGPGNEQGLCIAREPHNGNMWLSGGFTSDQLVFDNDTLINPTLIPGNIDPIFITEYDTAGHSHCMTALNGGGDDVNFINFDAAGYLYFGGDYYVDSFIVGNDTMRLTGAENLFLSKFRPCILPEAVKPLKGNDNEVAIFPNPAKEQFTVRYSGPADKNASISIDDLNGRLVKTVMLKGNESTIPTTGMPAGIYLCKISLKGKTIVQKLFIE
ncbi:MAG: hypothetical protein BGO69_01325 [Bacteroidetes bacterium 46-16]|nr:MAG: hypothetical protein BGO69_01325 [Bacteroidetes bacterium 46-16]